MFAVVLLSCHRHFYRGAPSQTSSPQRRVASLGRSTAATGPALFYVSSTAAAAAGDAREQGSPLSPRPAPAGRPLSSSSSPSSPSFPNSSSSSASSRSLGHAQALPGRHTAPYPHPRNFLPFRFSPANPHALVALEKFTFESWLNVRLAGRGVFVSDLFVDLRSGVILAHLAEVSF